MEALVASEEPPAGGQALYLSFTLGDELLAIDIRRVREIVGHDLLTALPTLPDDLLGLVDLRGAALPVIDLACRLGRAKSVIGWRSCIVVVETAVTGEKVDVGILVDAVGEILEMRPEQIEPPEAPGTGIGADCLRGMGRLGAGRVAILDIGRMLAPADLAVLERAAATGKE